MKQSQCVKQSRCVKQSQCVKCSQCVKWSQCVNQSKCVKRSLVFQIYLSYLHQNYFTPAKYGELLRHTDSAHTLVDDLFFSKYMNG